MFGHLVDVKLRLIASYCFYFFNYSVIDLLIHSYRVHLVM